MRQRRSPSTTAGRSASSSGGIAPSAAFCCRAGLFFGSGQIDRLTEYEGPGRPQFLPRRRRPGGSAHSRRAVRDRSRTRSRRQRAVGVLTRGCRQRRARRAAESSPVCRSTRCLSGKAMEARIEATVRDLRERVRSRVVSVSNPRRNGGPSTTAHRASRKGGRKRHAWQRECLFVPLRSPQPRPPSFFDKSWALPDLEKVP